MFPKLPFASFIKVWDLRNMRTAVASVNSDSSVNKLSVSGNNLIAVPYDNRNVRIFDLAGSRLARLARSSHQGHSRMVTATAWSSDSCLRPNLFTCGFDRQVIGWSVEPRDIQEEKEGFRYINKQATQQKTAYLCQMIINFTFHILALIKDVKNACKQLKVCFC